MLTLTEVFESTRLGKSFYYDVFGIPMKDVSFKKESGTWKLQYLSSSSQSLLKGFRILINGEVPIGARKWVPAKLSILDSGHEESMQCRSSIRLRPGADE
jgi:hypothetical protein